MRGIIGLGVAVCSVASLAAAPAAKDAKDDLKPLQGTWELVEYEAGGEKIDNTGHRLTVKGNQFTLKFKDGRDDVTGTVAVTAGKDFHAIDVTMGEGDLKGRKLLGIFRIKDGKQETCFAMPGTDRPTSFETKPGDNRYREVWKRATD